ncbi:unnamed protein product [Discosporangium mesarthrocarpum]
MGNSLNANAAHVGRAKARRAEKRARAELKLSNSKALDTLVTLFHEAQSVNLKNERRKILERDAKLCRKIIALKDEEG